jgi:hypothetical protein
MVVAKILSGIVNYLQGLQDHSTFVRHQLE